MAGVKRPAPVIDGLSWPVTGKNDKGECVRTSRTPHTDPLADAHSTQMPTELPSALCRDQRSTQETGKAILAAALQAADSEAAQKARDERSWRFKYKKHFVKSVEVSAHTPENALKVRQS